MVIITASVPPWFHVHQIEHGRDPLRAAYCYGVHDSERDAARARDRIAQMAPNETIQVVRSMTTWERC